MNLCAYCGRPIFGGPGVWHDAAGYERCDASPTEFHDNTHPNLCDALGGKE